MSFGGENICAGLVTGVYVRVTKYLKWIIENTLDSDYCKIFNPLDYEFNDYYV